MEMIQEPQFITDNKGQKTFAIISIDKYQDFQYDKANLKEENVPTWHKEILDEDLKMLKGDLQKNDTINDLSWEDLKTEIKAKYGY